jgi:hypothetical protein
LPALPLPPVNITRFIGASRWDQQWGGHSARADMRKRGWALALAGDPWLRPPDPGEAAA